MSPISTLNVCLGFFGEYSMMADNGMNKLFVIRPYFIYVMTYTILIHTHHLNIYIKMIKRMTRNCLIEHYYKLCRHYCQSIFYLFLHFKSLHEHLNFYSIFLLIHFHRFNYPDNLLLIDYYCYLNYSRTGSSFHIILWNFVTFIPLLLIVVYRIMQIF